MATISCLYKLVNGFGVWKRNFPSINYYLATADSSGKGGQDAASVEYVMPTCLLHRKATTMWNKGLRLVSGFDYAYIILWVPAFSSYLCADR